MSRREAEELFLLGHVGDAHRARLSKQQAEQTVAGWEVADACPRALVQPGGDEALEVGPGAVEDAERRVPRIDEPRRGIHGLLQDVVQRELGPDGEVRRGEFMEPPFAVCRPGHGHSTATVLRRRTGASLSTILHSCPRTAGPARCSAGHTTFQPTLL